MEEVGTLERRIVIGLVLSTDYLLHIHQKYDPLYLQSMTARTVSHWCLDYFKTYEKAPGAEIEALYDDWKILNEQDEDIVNITNWVCDILENLEETAQGLNVDYLITQSLDYFKKRSMENLKTMMEYHLGRNDLLQVEQMIADYRGVQEELCYGVTPLDDDQLVIDAFDESMKPMIQLPGVLGDMYNRFLIQDSLIGIMAPEKRGKTWFMMELQMSATKSNLPVAVFQCGDMSDKQWTRRQGIHLSKRNDMGEFCGKLMVPVIDCVFNQNDTCIRPEREPKTDPGVLFPELDNVTLKNMTLEEYKTVKACNPHHVACTSCRYSPDSQFRGALWYKQREKVQPLTSNSALYETRRFRKMFKAPFKLSTHPSGDLNIKQIKDILHVWEDSEGFVPKLILIDYADVLGAEDSRKELRHQQNETWQAMKGLSQVGKSLVIAATQTDADSYDRDSIGLKNFTNDKRKYSHVSAMFTLNQNKVEKAKGLMRIGNLIARESTSDDRQVKVIQRLEMGRFYLGSYL